MCCVVQRKLAIKLIFFSPIVSPNGRFSCLLVRLLCDLECVSVIVTRRQNRSYVPLPLIGRSASKAPADRVFQSTALLGTVNTFVKQNDGRFEDTVLFSQCSAVGPAFAHKSLVFGLCARETVIGGAETENRKWPLDAKWT